MAGKEYLVAGKWRRSTEELVVRCPYDGDVVGTTWNATARDAEEAAAAAYGFFRDEEIRPSYERMDVLRKLARLVRDNSEGLARTLALEAGKNIREARGEVGPLRPRAALRAGAGTRDNAFQFPVEPGNPQAGAGPGLRRAHRHQTGVRDATLRAQAGGAGSRSGRAPPANLGPPHAGVAGRKARRRRTLRGVNLHRFPGILSAHRLPHELILQRLHGHHRQFL